MNDQADKLRKKIEMLKAYRQAKTIAVVSGKGGVGKSNVALNFSLALAKKHKKVLIFDLDIGMGNIDILLGLTPKYSIVTMFDLQLSIHDIVEKGPNDISYVAAGSGLSEIFHMNELKFDFFIHQLNELINTYDYIIFDMGAGISRDSLYYMLAADECFVITTPEPTSLTDAYGIIKHMVNKKENAPLYLLVNRAPSSKSGQDTLERLQKVVYQFLQKNILVLGVIPEDKTVSQAVSRQIPFVLYKPNSLASIAMQQLVDQYVSDTIDVGKKVPHSFANKLKQFFKG
ncbi:MinD/ParA family protein [Aquibacillus salsiterrae]|uniref:MinD/ParA family protein n=1 Tax=Aquibacillus salsiterrae TaxID=2950439 RepID=A0A9X3WDC9_9BACI|nr:MinD/ParA family protein [Aquibacillus salsiterrae]MDC3416376.1 MinD/ParA family protein [Aquibacillus salsiterrae]